MKNDHPAFPNKHKIVSDEGDVIEVIAKGMSLRDYFAAKAMQAIMHFSGASLGTIAKSSYAMADAMLKAREENQKEENK